MCFMHYVLAMHYVFASQASIRATHVRVVGPSPRDHLNANDADMEEHCFLRVVTSKVLVIITKTNTHIDRNIYRYTNGDG